MHFRFVALASCVFVAAACGEDRPESPPDSGVPPVRADAAETDAHSDATVDEPDANENDAGIDDAGIQDAGVEDSGGNTNPSMSAGCGMPHATGETREMIDIDGQTREFIQTIPPTYDPSKPYPLVFGWHASGGSGAGIRSMGVYEQSGSTIITAHADGLRTNGGSGPTGWVLDPNGIDAALFDGMFTLLTSSLCIDLDHVYSYGFSFGGYMSNMLGCIRGDQLLAIAPFHGGGPSAQWTCRGTVSAMIAHRTDDNVVPISNGIASRDYWLAANGCDPTMSMPVEPEPCVEYFMCANGERVLWCLQETGGHAPPPDLASRTWEFFSQFLP